MPGALSCLCPCCVAEPVQEQLAQSLFDHIPVGVGSKGVIPTQHKDLIQALEMGMDWSLREGNDVQLSVCAAR